MSSAELQKRIADLEAENALLRRDVAILGPENAKLSNALALARNEIARLTAPKGKGRPTKDITGTYEDYLVRETMQIVTESLQGGGSRISERNACLIADKRIRATAGNAQAAGIPGPFAGLASTYSADEDSIYKAFRRGKVALGLGRKRQTKK